MAFIHGGNVYEIARNLGCSPDEILDYSASINPLGPPPGLADEILKYFSRIRHYPDMHNRELVEALARFHGVDNECVVVGNGSTELIYRLSSALGVSRAVAAVPTFSEYARAFELHGVRVGRVFTSAENGFQPTPEALVAACEAIRPQAVLLTNPGSPSGLLMDGFLKRWAINQASDAGGYVVLDEAFVDYCESASLKTSLDDAPGLVIVRSMTKFYGIPGLRIGYVLASPETAFRLRRLIPPWSVNTPAQIAGVYCLGDADYRRRTLELVSAERDRMVFELEETGAFRVFPGVANYLLVELRDGLPPVDVLQQALLASDRILIRDCSTFEGMSNRYARFAVRLPEENRRLLDGVRRWVESV